MTAGHKKKYAVISWNAYDVRTLREDWTLYECEEWLRKNEKYVRDRLIELGWDVIEALLPDKGRS